MNGRCSDVPAVFRFILGRVGLIQLAHERRLASAAEAEALFRVLGEKVVSASGYHTADPSRVSRIIDAIDPTRDHTISFEGGTVDRVTLDAYALTKQYGYLDVRTRETNLRAWPELYSWVHASAERAAEIAATEPTTHVDRETTIVIPKGDLATALRVFHKLGVTGIDRGFTTTTRAKPELAAMLIAFGARVHADLEIDVAVARSLAELYTGEPNEWQANGVIVRFPDGEIIGFARTPDVGKERKNWFKRIEKALAKL